MPGPKPVQSAHEDMGPAVMALPPLSLERCCGNHKWKTQPPSVPAPSCLSVCCRYKLVELVCYVIMGFFPALVILSMVSPCWEALGLSMRDKPQEGFENPEQFVSGGLAQSPGCVRGKDIPDRCGSSWFCRCFGYPAGTTRISPISPFWALLFGNCGLTESRNGLVWKGPSRPSKD